VALTVRVADSRPSTKTVSLQGKLNNETVAILDEALQTIVASSTTVVVFDLTELDYVSSVGLRSMFRMRKVMADRAGRALLVNPTPQVRKVLEIVNAVDVASVFASVQELDAYLDMMQKKVVDGE
jgi:anti-sigma B factor antagonist